MNDYLSTLVQQYQGLPLVIDTNLLLLLILGRFDLRRIEQYKRTRKYTTDDYVLLELMIEPFNRLVTTPNILTEVSNLSGYLEEPIRSQYFRYFAVEIRKSFEVYVTSASLTESAFFVPLGLADASILMTMQQERYLAVTDDLPLSVRLATDGFDVINFTHVRENYLHL